MARIKISFSPRMERAILDGRKCCTTRYEEKGRVGDTFTVGDRIYRIVEIRLGTLRLVRSLYFRQEGCVSPEDFAVLWESLHHESFEGGRTCCIHWFARVEVAE